MMSVRACRGPLPTLEWTATWTTTHSHLPAQRSSISNLQNYAAVYPYEATSCTDLRTLRALDTKTCSP